MLSAKNNDVKFDSIDVLNKDLMRTGIGELLEEYPDGQFIRQDASGKLSFFERDDDGAYYEGVEVWGCFGIVEATVIANHVISGSLILRLNIEGDEIEYFKIEPNFAAKVEPAF